MRRCILAVTVVFVFAAGLRAVTIGGGVPERSARHAAAVPSGGRSTAAGTALAAADEAWDEGHYIAALNDYIRILSAPGGDAFLETIALQTGELFETRELTRDGRAPRFSPDGRFIAYETGADLSRQTRIVKNDAGFAEVADLPGVSATFSPRSDKVAYLKFAANDELRDAMQALDRAPRSAANRGQLAQALYWQILRHTAIVVCDLTTQQETEITTAPDLMKTGLVYGADGRALYFLGGKDGDAARTDIYSVVEGARQASIVADAPGLKGPPVVDASGAVLIYTVPTQTPFRRPPPPGQAAQPGAEGAAAEEPGAPRATPPEGGRGGESGGRGGRAGRADSAGVGSDAPATDSGGQGRGTGDGRGGPPQPRSFGIVDLAARRVTIVDGVAPALSSDGKTLAYIKRSQAESALMVGAPAGAAAAIKKTNERLDAPALSPDGRRVAVQIMPKDDWEIVVLNRDGTSERRLTRDIQHDVLARFIGPDRVLAMKGEPRHRRSYLYDLGEAESTEATRLFHNNTVRTIAPEYQWAVSPDGQGILVGAERDGDTVSPERGVFLVDLRRKVTKAEVLARLRDNLRSETALEAGAVRAFQSIAPDVRSVLARESVAHIYGYEKSLFDFDSKHITRPGNRAASEYLFKTYSSFGYQPEYQWFEPRGALGGKTANVIATLKGTVNPDLVYVVSSHYDSVAGGPGADDDTSGTAALLEAARVLAGHPMPATIVFASFTGEEAGLLGSREFVRRAVEQKVKIVGALNNDTVGWSNDHRLDNTIRYSNAGIRDIQHGAAMLFTKLITYDALYFKSTDAAAYVDAYGDVVGGIGSYPVLASPHYHQATDLLEYENHQQIAETSKATVAALMLLASSPSRITNLKIDQYSGTTAVLSWTPSPERDVKGSASYVVMYGPPARPHAHRLTVGAPRATIPHIEAGSVVSVKAVNVRRLEGWDWAKITVGQPSGNITQTQQ